MSDFLPDCMIGPSEPCKGFTQMQDRLRAELAAVSVERDRLVSIGHSVAEERDELKIDTAAKDARIAEQTSWAIGSAAANEMLRKRIAELEGGAWDGLAPAEEDIKQSKRMLFIQVKGLQTTSYGHLFRAEQAEARIAELEAWGDGLRDSLGTTISTMGEERARAERANARIVELEARLACRSDTNGDCVMDESPETPCNERNCRYVAVITRAERAEAQLLAERSTAAYKDVRIERAEAERDAMREREDKLMRAVIDKAWGEALEDGSVPSTKLQDKIIGKARAALAPPPAGREG